MKKQAQGAVVYVAPVGTEERFLALEEQLREARQETRLAEERLASQQQQQIALLLAPREGKRADEGILGTIQETLKSIASSAGKPVEEMTTENWPGPPRVAARNLSSVPTGATETTISS